MAHDSYIFQNVKLGQTKQMVAERGREGWGDKGNYSKHLSMTTLAHQEKDAERLSNN